MISEYVRSSEVDEYELASARVEWVRSSTCLDLPAQRDALAWHLASRAAAFAALTGSDFAADWLED